MVSADPAQLLQQLTDWRPVAKGLILDPALKRATMGDDD